MGLHMVQHRLHKSQHRKHSIFTFTQPFLRILVDFLAVNPLINAKRISVTTQGQLNRLLSAYEKKNWGIKK